MDRNDREKPEDIALRLELARSYKAFGPMLRFLVREAGYASAIDFAEAVSVSERTVGRWFREEFRPSDDEYATIKAVLNDAGVLPVFGGVTTLLNHLYEAKPVARNTGESKFSQAFLQLTQMDKRMGNTSLDALATNGPSIATLEVFLPLRDQVTAFAEQAENLDQHADQIADLFELVHYNDRFAVARKITYLPIGKAALKRLHDRRRKGGLRFTMAFARICEHAGEVDLMGKAYELLGHYLGEMGDALNAEMVREKTDHLLALRGLDDICGDLDGGGSTSEALALAGARRCAACKATKLQRFDEVRTQVDAAFGHLGNLEPSRAKDQIENYLEMMLIAADWHERKVDARSLEQRIYECIERIEIDPRDKPLIIGLYGIMLQASAELPALNSGDADRKERAKNCARLIQGLSERSVPTFCAFDLRSIRQMADDELRIGNPPF